MKRKNILVIGGSFAGVSTAHRILKLAAKTTATVPFKITLVTRDTHFYWNIAAPRAIIPGQIPEEKVFQDIVKGFQGYPAGLVEVVVGSAVGLDVNLKKVKVDVGSDDGEKKVVEFEYDFLILGTGSQTKEATPFKSLGSSQATREGLRRYQEHIKMSKKIVVVGAGPTGVEVAGELAGEFGGSKRIYVLSRGEALLEGRPASVSKTAMAQLQALGVDVRLSTSIEDTAQLPDGCQELILSKGETLVVDMYIPTFGVQPNSSYIPTRFLNDQRFVKVDEYLSVKGASGIFAIGDVSDAEPPQFWFVDKQSTHMAKNLLLALSGKALVPYKVSATGMMGVQIGKKSGTGHYGSMKLPSFVVSMLRKSLFVEMLPRTVDGSQF